jgi:conjugal transfer/type IV secretion protein DotA/TraY
MNDAINFETILGAAGPLGEQVKALLFDTLAPTLLVINGAGLALGIVILMYSIVAGVAQTAHEGQFMGKRFSSIWLPIRLVTGAALLIPAWGGIAAAQKIVLWFAVMGIGLANLAADALTIPNPQFFIPGPTAQQLAQQEFIRQSCKVGINFGYQGLAGLIPEGGYMAPREDICGAVTWPVADTDVDTSDGSPAGTLLQARQKTFKAMSDKLHKIAEADYIHRLEAEDLKAQIELAAQEYSLSMKSAGADLVQQKKQAQQQKPTFIEFGFIGSFSSIKQQQIATAIAALPKISGTQDADTSAYGEVSLMGKQCSDNYCPPSWWDMRNSLSARLGIDLTSGGKPPTLAHLQNASAGSTSSPYTAADGDGLIRKLLGNVSLKEWAANWATGGATSPILYAQNLGQNLLNIIGAAGAVAVILAMVPAFGTPVMPVFISVAIPLSAMAIALASYVPLIPSILWLMALVSWIVLILEGLLGSVLWALIHLDPEGEGMGSRAQRGYLFLADLFFRPAFLVVAFAAANIILIFVAGLSNGFFVKALSGYEIGGLGSLIGFLGALGVCVMVLVGLVSRVYAQCLSIPDQIMMWLGGMGTSPSVSHTDAHSVSGQQVGDAARGLSNVRPAPKTKPDAGTDTKVS